MIKIANKVLDNLVVMFGTSKYKKETKVKTLTL